MEENDTLKIYTDGASRGNPGDAAFAFIFVNNDKIIYSESGNIGETTNNVAEYTALIKALEKAKEYKDWKIEVYSDSLLLINQINGKWKVKKEHIKRLFNRIIELKSVFKEIKFFQITREERFIKYVDSLCNRRLDEI
jgi:ribonuclease HI